MAYVGSQGQTEENKKLLKEIEDQKRIKLKPQQHVTPPPGEDSWYYSSSSVMTGIVVVAVVLITQVSCRASSNKQTRTINY